MGSGPYRRSARLYLWLLAIWSVIGFSLPKLVPGAVVLAVGLLLTALICLSQFRRVTILTGPLLLVVLAIAAPIWTGDGSSWQKAVLYSVVTLAAFVIGSYMEPRDAIRTFDIGFKVVVVATVAILLFARNIAFDDRWPNVGTLIGPYAHKNLLGTILVLGLITSFYVQHTKHRKLEVVIWTLAYGVLLVMVHSSTAFVLSVLAIPIALVMRMWSRRDAKRQSAQITLTVIALVIVIPIIIASANNILAFLGRDDTLSGRSRIWDYTIVAWRERPLLGYGWSTAYDENSTAANIIQSVTGWYVPSSHNGYLSMLLQLGLVGCAILVLFAGGLLASSFGRAARNPDPVWRWMFQVSLVWVVNNLFDTRLDTTAWFMAVAVAVWTRRAKSATKVPSPQLAAGSRIKAESAV